MVTTTPSNPGIREWYNITMINIKGETIYYVDNTVIDEAIKLSNQLPSTIEDKFLYAVQVIASMEAEMRIVTNPKLLETL